MKLDPVHRNDSYASRSHKASRGKNGRSCHANQYAGGSLHRWAIMGKREHTPILTIVVIPSQTGPLQKSGEHVNTHITDGHDEVISMNLIRPSGPCRRELPQ